MKGELAKGTFGERGAGYLDTAECGIQEKEYGLFVLCVWVCVCTCVYVCVCEYVRLRVSVRIFVVLNWVAEHSVHGVSAGVPFQSFKMEDFVQNMS